jgi:CRP-like cAMP-binding protein
MTVERRMMSKPRATHEQFLSKVTEHRKRLQYLTANDWALLIDRSDLLKFHSNDTLILQGKPMEVLYLIAAGTVNVSISGVQVAELEPGEICGEMGFLENGLPSATATAAGEVEAYALKWSSLIDLFELFPHLASRFYRSLALNLSRRLRDLYPRLR